MWINIFVGVATITNPLESSKNMPLFVCSTTMYRYLLFCILVNGANQNFGRIRKIYVHLSAYITMASMRLLICFFRVSLSVASSTCCGMRCVSFVAGMNLRPFQLNIIIIIYSCVFYILHASVCLCVYVWVPWHRFIRKFSYWKAKRWMIMLGSQFFFGSPSAKCCLEAISAIYIHFPHMQYYITMSMHAYSGTITRVHIPYYYYRCYCCYHCCAAEAMHTLRASRIIAQMLPTAHTTK